MQYVRTMGLALVAALALSVVAASSASASSFLAHPTSNIVGSGTNTHEFRVNAGTVECVTVAINGTAPVLKSLHQLVHVQYSNCTAFGFINVNISSALYLFSADLKVSLQNKVTIDVGPGICQITVTPAGNQNLDSVHYRNEGADLKVNALVKGITYGSTGGPCGEPGSNGEYFGEARLRSTTVGGVVRWDKE